MRASRNVLWIHKQEHAFVAINTYNPTKNLRSAGKHLLEVPNVRLKSYGDRAFSVAAPKHWNEIPLDIKLSRSVDVFKSRLKTYLFRLAFNWLLCFSAIVS